MNGTVKILHPEKTEEKFLNQICVSQTLKLHSISWNIRWSLMQPVAYSLAAAMNENPP